MKNLLVILVLLFMQKVANGQETYIKTIDGSNFGQHVRVLPTSDQNFAVFSLDSLKLYKFNSCGNVEWAKQYDLPIGFYVGDIIRTQAGGFALLNRVPLGNRSAISVTVLDAAGNIIWSKQYENPLFNYVTYTINQDANGNFILIANATHINLQPNYNLITRLDANGNVLWAKFYYLGAIWGGSIVTSDGGILARFGQSYLKTDGAGNIQWISSIFGGGYYYAPIEVSDGYIFPDYNNEHFFLKIDKQGNMLWGGRKKINYSGALAWLTKKSNGNFVCTFSKWVPNKSLTTLFEFDKDLNLVKQNTLNFGSNVGTFTGKHVGFSDDNATIFAGKATPLNHPLASQLFVGKTNAQFLTGCDTTLTLNITTEPVTQTFLTSPVLTHTLQETSRTIPVKTIPATVTTYCSNFIATTLNIHTDTILCQDGSLTLQNKSGTAFDAYRWSTGETTPAITINKPGKYWLRTTYNCGSQTASDTVIVTPLTFPQPALTADTAICGASPVLINAEIPEATYRWQDGSTNAIYRATKPGNYEVEITYRSCTKKFSVQIGDHEKLVMPNIFTPNGDGLNERFAPMEMCGIASGTLKIFNRWGQQIYTTSEINKGWNGKVNGKKGADGVYFYLVEYTGFNGQQKMKKGWVDLVGN
jgi:gliding motility-associated-like protein